MSESNLNELNDMITTFDVEFADFVVLYRGVERVWIDDPGTLHAEMVDGAVQDLGPVTSYYYALEHGFEGTFEEWVQVIEDGSDNAQAAAASAAAALVSENNAAASETASLAAQTAAETAQGLAETAQGLAEDAQQAAETAQASAEAAQQASETAQGLAEDAQAAAEGAQSAAEDAQTASESAQALSEAAQEAAETAQGLAEDAQAAAETAQGLAETAQGLAESAQAAAEQASSDAALAQSAAEIAQGLAEDFELGAQAAQVNAEAAASHYPRIANNNNWETWDVENQQWEDTGHSSIAEATITYAYQNSSDGTTVPAGTWSSTPNPQGGMYIWARTTYTWTNGTVDNFYNVSYIGASNVFDDISFSIATTDWTGSQAPYTYLLENAKFSAASVTWTFFDSSYQTYARDNITTTISAAGVTFSTDVMPTGTITGVVRVANRVSVAEASQIALDGKVDIDQGTQNDGKVLGVNSQGLVEPVDFSDLPAVTSTDNGKFLRVVNGAWAAAQVANASGVSF